MSKFSISILPHFHESNTKLYLVFSLFFLSLSISFSFPETETNNNKKGHTTTLSDRQIENSNERKYSISNLFERMGTSHIRFHTSMLRSTGKVNFGFYSSLESKYERKKRRRRTIFHNRKLYFICIFYCNQFNNDNDEYDALIRFRQWTNKQ